MPFTLPDQIHGGRIFLQRLRYEFAEEIFFAYASKPEATRFVSWPTHRSIEDTRRYTRYAVPAWEAGTDYSFVIRLKDSNRLIGSIGCLNDDGKVQFGYILSPVFWNKGYATEAAQILLNHVKSVETVYRIWTFTDLDNLASQKVLLKNGLIEEARLTNWFRFVNQDKMPRTCILFKVPDEFLAFNLVSK
jgi:ribosomal-protein-alanine N-acetyltransferase